MRNQAIGQPDVGSLALAEPTQHVRYRWIVGLTLASLGMWMANQTPSQVMLALQLQDITPRHKIVALGVVTAINAVASALATPVVGALSDRTAHGRRLGRFSGRRHRWTLVMVLLAAVCLALMAKAGTVVAVTLLWLLFGVFQNGEYASLSAAVPDHVPVRQRATVSGWVGMPLALGLVLGTVLVVEVFDQDLVTGYIVLAVLMVVLMVVLALPFVLPVRHRPADRGPPGFAGRLPGPVRGDRGGGHRGLDRRLADQERQLKHPPPCPALRPPASPRKDCGYLPPAGWEVSIHNDSAPPAPEEGVPCGCVVVNRGGPCHLLECGTTARSE
ncbi:MAG: MFS transporter [Streptosporangiaceae bacterium]